MKTWQLTQPLDAVIFDCDGTLSQVEGIDALACMNHVAEVVQRLTEEAMGGTGLNTELYARRLELVKPTQAQTEQVEEIYYSHLTPGVDRVISILAALKKPVYVISAGLLQPVVNFAARLGIPSERVFAVEIYFDEAGAYRGYNHLSPITHQRGKGIIIQKIKEQFPRLMHIGDGMNDVEVADKVTRFVGYGGSFYRESIAHASPFYINTPSMLSILPLSLTEEEVARLDQASLAYYQEGLADITSGRVLLS